MLVSRIPFVMAVVAGFLSAAVPGCDVRVKDTYEPVPPRFDFPANPDQLQTYVNTNDVHHMRAHAWHVFAGLTNPSRHNPKLPIWETWYDKADVFSDPSKPVTHAEPLRPLAAPVELRPAAKGNLAAFMLYNRETCEAIRDNSLYRQSVLNDLRSKPPRDVAQLEHPFRPSSVALKTSWMVVHKDSCSQIPVWNFERLAPGSLSNISSNWPDQVWIRPSAGLCPNQPNAYSLDWAKAHFYWFQIPNDPAQLAEVQNSIQGPVEPGDYAVLVGLHFATKELSNWVWATFWWHNHPDQGIYADDRPGPAVLKGVWRNYLMNVAYDMDKPREPDGRPHIAYNPYLEGNLINGLESNCMTCHRRATWPVPADVQTAGSWTSGSSQFQGLVVRGHEAATATYFNEPGFECRLKLGFLWSLAQIGIPSSSSGQACSQSGK
jgi:hypothetical protein